MIRRPLALIAALGLAVLASCGGDDSSSPTSSSTGVGTTAAAIPTTVAPTTAAATTTTEAAPTTEATTTTTLPPVPILPAGMQFSDEAVTIDPNLYLFTPDADGYLGIGTARNEAINTCARGVQGCTSVAFDPVAFIDGTPVTIDDSTTLDLPAGFGQMTGMPPTSITRGPAGIVVTGASHVWDSNRFLNTRILGMLWHSTDGSSWQRTDVRDLVGDRDSELTSVVATDDGFVAVGHVAGKGPEDGPSHPLVVTSPDGVIWTAHELPSTYAVELQSAVVDGDDVLLRGVEYVCTLDAGAMNDFSVGAQVRLWASRDGGATFDPIDLGPTGLVDEMPPAPADPTTCVDDLNTNSAFRFDIGLADVANGQFVATSGNGATVAVSSDLQTWNVADLEGAQPTPGSSSIAQVAGRVMLPADDGGLDLVVLESARDADNNALETGWATRGWHTSDGGKSWEPYPVPAPFELVGQPYLVESSDGSVYLLVYEQDADRVTTAITARRSEAGPLITD